MKYSALIIVFLLFHPEISGAQENLIVTKAQKETILTGYSRSSETVTVSSEISGKVLKVNYDVGQTIGDRAFFEIDHTFIDFQIDNTLQSIERLDIIIRKATSRTAYLEKEYLRISKLYDEELATESRKDALQQELEQAQLERDSAKKEKSILQTTLNELRERKNRHFITAPKGWIVTDRTVEAGEVIQPGIPLAKASDYRTLTVPLSLSNEELEALQSLPMEFDADLDGKPVKVSINWINPEFDERTRKLAIELVIKSYKGMKRGGLKLSIPLRIDTEGMNVPKIAVTDRYENPTVILKQTGEKVPLLVLGESDNNLIVAEDERLKPGIELLPASAIPTRLKE